MKQFHWLICVAKNCDWSRKIGPLSNLEPDSSVAPCWMKTYSESRIDLRNLQILKKMLKKSSQFLLSEQPCEPKSLDVALKITGVEKIPSEPRCHLIRVLNERSVATVPEIFVFCGWWFSNQFDIESEAHFSCNAVGRELWLAIFCWLLCPEAAGTFVSKSKVMCLSLVYFYWF